MWKKTRNFFISLLYDVFFACVILQLPIKINNTEWVPILKIIALKSNLNFLLFKMRNFEEWLWPHFISKMKYLTKTESKWPERLSMFFFDGSFQPSKTQKLQKTICTKTYQKCTKQFSFKVILKKISVFSLKKFDQTRVWKDFIEFYFSFENFKVWD